MRPDYAPPAPRFHRLWIIPVTIVPLVVLVAWVVPLAKRTAARWQLLRQQARALAYRAPADQVVYESDPAEAAKLLSLGGGYERWNAPESPAFHIPQFWRGHRQPLGQSGHALVFLHERTSPGGNRRLVVVELGHLSYQRFADILFLPSVIELGTIGREPKYISAHGGTFSAYVSASERLRVFAGQPDPADKSHFTFDYEIEYQGNSKRGTFDGWLKDNDRVVLKPRIGERRPPYGWQPGLMHGLSPNGGAATSPASKPSPE